MSENGSSPMTEIERDFVNELKGEGSLSLYVADGGEKSYLGWDVNPEDIESIYFDGIGVPRWESIKADDVEQQTALYWERFNERMDKYPLIGRARDTDVRVEYSPDEIPGLVAECERVVGGTSDSKTKRAVQKFSLAAEKAAEKNAGLTLKPSLPAF